MNFCGCVEQGAESTIEEENAMGGDATGDLTLAQRVRFR